MRETGDAADGKDCFRFYCERNMETILDEGHSYVH